MLSLACAYVWWCFWFLFFILRCGCSLGSEKEIFLRFWYIKIGFFLWSKKDTIFSFFLFFVKDFWSIFCVIYLLFNIWILFLLTMLLCHSLFESDYSVLTEWNLFLLKIWNLVKFRVLIKFLVFLIKFLCKLII